jgi:hypothetical protein
MMTYEQKKALVLEISQICEDQGERYESSKATRDYHEKKGKKARWRNWDKFAASDLGRWGAYNDMLYLVVQHLFDCSEKDVHAFVRDLKEEG